MLILFMFSIKISAEFFDITLIDNDLRATGYETKRNYILCLNSFVDYRVLSDVVVFTNL